MLFILYCMGHWVYGLILLYKSSRWLQYFSELAVVEQDLRTLLDTGAYSDAVLVFASSPAAADVDPTAPAAGASSATRPFAEGSGSGSRRSRGELRCHKVIDPSFCLPIYALLS